VRQQGPSMVVTAAAAGGASALQRGGDSQRSATVTAHPSPAAVFRSPPQTPIPQAQFRTVVSVQQPMAMGGRGRGSPAVASTAPSSLAATVRCGSKDGGPLTHSAASAPGAPRTVAGGRLRRESLSSERAPPGSGSQARRPRSSGPVEPQPVAAVPPQQQREFRQHQQQLQQPMLQRFAGGGSPRRREARPSGANISNSTSTISDAGVAPGSSGNLPPASPAVQQRVAASHQPPWQQGLRVAGYPAEVAPSPYGAGRALHATACTASSTAASLASALGQQASAPGPRHAPAGLTRLAPSPAAAFAPRR